MHRTLGSGTFGSDTGAVLLYGVVSITTDTDLHMIGAGTSASGTVALNGFVAIAADKDLHMTIFRHLRFTHWRSLAQ